MKINDAVWGSLFLLLGVMILFHVQSFPTIPGQKVGPALFPGVIAAGLAVCASILIVQGIAGRRKPGERSAWLGSEPWMRSPQHVLAFFLVIGVNVFYILVVDRLGFIPTGTIYLAVLFAVFGVRPRNNLVLALVITLVIHYAFYKLLRVPLPWGMLEKWAW
ncbi:MAG: tripartite tricarboxylate transporter TctB family protein [Betaproteobacteria bacterium]|nr:MAG: tripartite tricarboxylate transporter TctB family protein [Betaproteobacteria bacterium]TMH00718.1 MAG: tripartite tricarboxylate transporter TctB family protein [Betaproteobacteria bacterium]